MAVRRGQARPTTALMNGIPNALAGFAGCGRLHAAARWDGGRGAGRSASALR
jgi:hypothetical protein